MKKVLIFCLILLCTLSVFAADVSAAVAFHVTYGESGYGFNMSKGTWERPILAFSTSTEKAGASIKLNLNFESMDIDTNVWLKKEFTESAMKFTLGGLFSFSYKNGLTKTDSYSIIDYNHSDEIIAKAGFAYKPIDCKDFSNANVFVAGSFNYVNETVGVFHIDELTKLKVQDNKPELNYALVETSYGLPLDDWVGTGYSKNCLTDSFGYDESVYFEHWNSDWFKHDSSTAQSIKPSFGVRYKYYAEADMQDENGWYGVALAGGTIYNEDNTETSKISNLYGECELEFGRNGSEFAGKIVGAEGKFSHKTLVGFEMDWTNGFKFRPELYSKVAYADTISPYLIINFNDAYSNFTADDGIYFNPGFTTNVGLCALDIGATVGFDSLKNFRWNTQSTFFVSF